MISQRYDNSSATIITSNKAFSDWAEVFAGDAIMASAAGAIRTWMGDYQFAFLSGGIIAMIAAGLALQIRTKPREAAPAVGVQPAGA